MQLKLTGSARLKDGAIQLTHAEGHPTATLTVRGKDHELTATELREISEACIAAAKRIELQHVVAVMFRGMR